MSIPGVLHGRLRGRWQLILVVRIGQRDSWSRDDRHRTSGTGDRASQILVRGMMLADGLQESCSDGEIVQRSGTGFGVRRTLATHAESQIRFTGPRNSTKHRHRHKHQHELSVPTCSQVCDALPCNCSPSDAEAKNMQDPSKGSNMHEV